MTQSNPGNAPAIQPGNTLEIPQKTGELVFEGLSAKLLGVVYGLVAAGLLTVGLWPFQSPRNQVTWFAGGNGLHFGHHGTILSSGPFGPAPGAEDSPCSIEVWLEPNSTDSSTTLLTFYKRGGPRQFSLHQSVSDLSLRSDFRDEYHRTQTAEFYVGDIFRRGKALFITITASGWRTSVYIDGALAEVAPKFPLSGKDFDGELVVANWPAFENSWSGLLRGLAFYHQELSAAQVLHHYETWSQQGRPDVSEDDRAVALYLFDEHTGHVIHNQVPSGIGLYIPYRYVVFDEVFFRPFWEGFHWRWSYWSDILINIAGFIPFGFLCFAYFSLAGHGKRPALVTVLLGFAISLTIEFFQAFLPTRDSGTTDLMTNTLGTYLGALLCKSSFLRDLFIRIWLSLTGIISREGKTSQTI